MARDLKEILSPRDRSILDATPGSQWVPKDPRDTLLPYLDKDPPPVRKDLDARRQKAKDIYDNYGKIVEQCKELEDEISEQCKNVEVTVDPKTNLQVRDAIRRVFGLDGTKITFEMYKICLAQWAQMGKSKDPTAGGQPL